MRYAKYVAAKLLFAAGCCVIYHACVFHLLPWLASRRADRSVYRLASLTQDSQSTWHEWPTVFEATYQVDLPRAIGPYVYWGMLLEYLPPRSVIENVVLVTEAGQQPRMFVWLKGAPNPYEFVFYGMSHAHLRREIGPIAFVAHAPP